MLYVAVEPCLLKRGAAGQLEAAGLVEAFGGLADES